MYSFEKIYTANGSELSNAAHDTALSGAFSMVHDGRYIWVSSGTRGVFVFEYWGERSDDEPTWETLDETQYARYDSGSNRKLRLITSIELSSTQMKRTTSEASLASLGATEYLQSYGKAYTLVSSRTGSALNATYMAKIGNRIYVASGSQFSEIFVFDVPTHTFVTSFSVSENITGTDRGMNSNLCSSGGKLWFAGGFSILESQDPERQKLYCWDPATTTKTTIDLNVRPTLTRTWICDGFNGHVYLSNFNDVSVLKVNNITYAQTYIRVNSSPVRVFSGQDRRIFVVSYAGMLSLVDWDDDQVHNSFATELGALSGAADPTDSTKFWFIRSDQRLVRYDLSLIEQLEQGTVEDWHFNSGLLGSPEELMITGQMVYDVMGTPVTVKPYLFMISDNRLLGIRLDNYLLYREAYFEMNGQSAVASGPEQYFGET